MLMEKFKSRKFWMAVVSAALVIANKGLDLNIPEESIIAIAGIASSYIFGQAYVDGKKDNY